MQVITAREWLELKIGRRQKSIYAACRALNIPSQHPSAATKSRDHRRPAWPARGDDSRTEAVHSRASMDMDYLEENAADAAPRPVCAIN